MDVIIGLGFEGSSNPAGFRDLVRRVVTRLGVVNAEIGGVSVSSQWGAEEGVWFAATFPDFATYVEARERILAIGAVHRQDAIAFTVGNTDVAECRPRA